MPYLGVKPADITSATQAEIAGDLTVDTNTLVVDAANNRVGIGTASPSVDLEIASTAGSIKLSDTDGSDKETIIKHSGGAFFLLARDGSSNAPIVFGGNGGGSFDEHLRVLSGGGLTFNGDTAAANALDDAEYGTFTVTDASGAGLTLTQNVTARYAKIGRLVFVNFYVTYPTTSASGTATLGGFPFGGSTNSYSYLIGRTGNHAANDMVWQLNNTSAQLHYNNLGKSNSELSGQYVLLSGCYYTDN